MQNCYPPVIEKSFEIIKRFEEKFGWFSIRVYHFPQVDGFGTFLESVQRTLLRHKTIGWYLWANIRGTNQLLLIYFGRGQWHGHFEQETNEIIPQLWQRQFVRSCGNRKRKQRHYILIEAAWKSISYDLEQRTRYGKLLATGANPQRAISIIAKKLSYTIRAVWIQNRDYIKFEAVNTVKNC